MADSLNTPTLSKLHHSLSRRSLMREIAGAVAVTVAASSPTFAATDGQLPPPEDARLIDLGKSLEEVSQRYREVSDHLEVIYTKVENSYPPLPLVMKATEADVEFGLPKPNNAKFYKRVVGGSYEQPGYYTTFHLRELEQFDACLSVKIPVDMHVPEYSKTTGKEFPALILQSENVILTSREWPEAQARVKELTAAIRRWEKACKRVEQALHYGKTCKEVDALGEQQHQLLTEIADTPAQSMEGLKVKLRALQIIFHHEGKVELGDFTADRLAAGVVNGLMPLLPTLEGRRAVPS